MGRAYSRMDRRGIPEGIFLDRRNNHYRVTVKLPGRIREYVGTTRTLVSAIAWQKRAMISDGESRVILRDQPITVPEVRFVWGVAFPKEKEQRK